MLVNHLTHIVNVFVEINPPVLATKLGDTPDANHLATQAGMPKMHIPFQVRAVTSLNLVEELKPAHLNIGTQILHITVDCRQAPDLMHRVFKYHVVMVNLIQLTEVNLLEISIKTLELLEQRLHKFIPVCLVTLPDLRSLAEIGSITLLCDPAEQ
jgi:hypothetical protein